MTDLNPGTKELEKRRDGLAKWLKKYAPETGREQKHLDMGTEARAYWHHGYFMAIKDVLRLLDKRGEAP